MNFEKSKFVPSQNVEYLGYEMRTDSIVPSICVPQQRLKRLKRTLHMLYEGVRLMAGVGKDTWTMCGIEQFYQVNYFLEIHIGCWKLETV